MMETIYINNERSTYRIFLIKKLFEITFTFLILISIINNIKTNKIMITIGFDLRNLWIDGVCCLFVYFSVVLSHDCILLVDDFTAHKAPSGNGKKFFLSPLTAGEAFGLFYFFLFFITLCLRAFLCSNPSNTFCIFLSFFFPFGDSVPFLSKWNGGKRRHDLFPFLCHKGRHQVRLKLRNRCPAKRRASLCEKKSWSLSPGNWSQSIERSYHELI